MQTFLPLPSFEASLRCLDWKRLGNQRRETKGLLTILSRNETKGWANTPLIRMWRGYENALKLYLNLNIIEWERRGYNNSMPLEDIENETELPPWLGQPRLHSSHRAALLAKAPAYYSQFDWKEEPALGYWWPVVNPSAA